MSYISEKENSLLGIESHCHFFSAFTANRENLKSVLSDRCVKPFFGNQSFLSSMTWIAVSARAGIVSMREQSCAGVLETKIYEAQEKYQHSDSPLPADPLWVPVNVFIHIFRGRKPALSISYTENPGNMRKTSNDASSRSDNAWVPKHWSKLEKKHLPTLECNWATV